jgi:hypothetical protein
MHSYDLVFADGKRCRYLDPDEDGLIPSNFHSGYLVSVERIIPPIPEKLPWRRTGAKEWRIGKFVLVRLDDGFEVSWPGGSACGGKEEVSKAVRENWRLGC